MSKLVTLDDRSFKLFITEEQILAAIERIAASIDIDYAGRCPIIVPILNGSFMFAADLVKRLQCSCEISFIKASSYKGTTSTGALTELIGLSESIQGRDIIIIEDIIDTGHTLAKIIPTMQSLQPASIRVATLLYKPAALQTAIDTHYIGISIPNEFIVGYGLDYKGLGRNLRDIYQVI